MSGRHNFSGRVSRRQLPIVTSNDPDDSEEKEKDQNILRMWRLMAANQITDQSILERLQNKSYPSIQAEIDAYSNAVIAWQSSMT